MPWREVTVVHQREEFVRLASQEGANVSELCRRFEISRKTGYKWLGRWSSDGLAGLQDQSVRPRNSPGKTAAAIEAKVLQTRQAHPAWGARKIAHVLQRDHGLTLAVSTVNTILKRHGCITAQASQAATAWHRFEHEAPNELWQMDFKGHFAVGLGRCHPLTVLDDHSRFNLVLEAAAGESLGEVQPRLQRAFERYGLPRRINTDNGPPWMASGQADLTRFGVWLIRLDVALSNSRPAHPQTNGKEERFHRTLKAEVLGSRQFTDFADVQRHFDDWRHIYNFVRPHQAMSMQTPSQRYQPSPRSMPKTMPAIEYGPEDVVRKVQSGGWISLGGRAIRLSQVLQGLPVALRSRADDDALKDVFLCHHRITTIDLRVAT
jgi:transposase InsO family protein